MLGVSRASGAQIYAKSRHKHLRGVLPMALEVKGPLISESNSTRNNTVDQ